MSRRSKPYDWLGIETAIQNRNIDEAIVEGAKLPKFDEKYFREFVAKIKNEINILH